MTPVEEGERDLAHDLPLPPLLGGDDDQAARMQRRKRNLLRDALEVAASSALSHPNLLQVGGCLAARGEGWGGRARMCVCTCACAHTSLDLPN